MCPVCRSKIFSLLAQKNINVDIILQTTGRDGKKDMSFTVPLGDAESAVAALKNRHEPHRRRRHHR